MLMIHVCVAYSCQGLVSSLSWTCYVLSTGFHCHVGSKPFVCFSVSHILLTILPGELICSLKESKSFSVSIIPSDSDTTHCSSPAFCASCPITLYKPWATLPYLCPQKQSFPLTKYIRKGQPLVLETPHQQFENEERKVLKGSQISW